ncbi:unnamed protein product [Effrenium voratum]|uniref:Uncharacterized protein n=1 Tax=Effrenium voratum TaxID=2562239 RepID=A0AA36MW10_9DINO|nr:unnamed protein product [Effrenium voratum]
MRGRTSFQQLLQRSTRLAGRLAPLAPAAQPEGTVGLCGVGGDSALAALLACLQLAVPYTPLGAEAPSGRLAAPEARLAALIDLAQVWAVLCSADLVAQVQSAWRPEAVLNVDADFPEAPSLGCGAPPESSGVLYVLFTSGSTGQPKGVEGTEAATLNRLRWQWRRFPWAVGEVAVARTPLTFVDHVAEIFGALLAEGGPSLALADAGLQGLRCLQDFESTRLVLTPTLLSAALAEDVWQSVQLLTCSGEVLSRSLLEKARRKLPETCRILNIYGATEVAGDATCAELPRDDEAGLPVVCCGRAIDNTEVEVRAEESEEGEVYISGACLCRGYFRDLEATSAAFGGGSGAKRAFRSFDLGRWQATKGGKSLVILGRCNQLVKVRGQRVALSFVEESLCSEQLAAALGRQSAGPVFSEAVCVVTREGALVAAVILAPAWREVALADVRRCLGQQLPGAAVPALRAVAALPRLGAGKVDRRAARDLAEEPGATLSDLPLAAGPEDLRELWQACLPLKVEDWNCSFADAGGDSAGVMKLASLLRQKMGVDYDAVMAAAAESFAALARLCEAAAKAPHELQAAEAPARKAARRGPSPRPGPDVRAAPAWLARGGTCRAAGPVSEVSLSWRADLHQCVDASPLLVPGERWRLLIGSHSHELACFDADTGTELWRVTLTDRLEGACAWGLGPEEEACAFAAGYDGKMHCVSVASGALRWSQLVAPEDQDRDTEVKSAPVVAGRVVLTGTHGGSVAGLCCRSGRRLWRVPASGAVFAPVLVAAEHMYVCTTTGQSLSKFHFAGGDFAERPRHQRSRRLAAPIFAAPLPLSASEAAQAAALVLSVEGLLRRVELEELTDLWVRQLPGHCFGTPCLCHAENLAFVGTHGEQVLCIDLADGAIRWQVSIGDVVYGSPFLVESSRNPALCIATRRGKLFFLDARDGSAISTSAQLEGEDVVIDLECDLPVGSKLLDLSATFTGPLGLQTLQAEALLQEAAPSAECVFQRWRLRLAELLRELLRRGEARLKEAQDLVQEFLKELRLARQEVPLLEGLLEDVQGQVAEAVSRQDWYTSWGAHYLRSLSRAHLSQVCNNFKDPGVQGYGGELFQDVRDVADEIFLKLPPPNPAVRSGMEMLMAMGFPEVEVTRALDFAHNDVETAATYLMEGFPARRPPAPGAVRPGRSAPAVDMSHYYDASGG